MSKYFDFLKQQLTIIIFLIIVNFFVMTINSSYAITAQEQQIIKQQQIIRQQQEQQRQQEINQQKIDEVERIRNTRAEFIDNNDNEENLLETNIDDSKCKINFKSIKVEGNKVFSTKKLEKKVLNKYLDKCMNKKNIQLIQNELIKFYFDRGYTNTRVYFDINTEKQNLKNGILNVIIEEGIVNNITIINTKINNKSKQEKQNLTSQRTKLQTFFAFPFLKNKPFNIRDYEQGLDQINKLQSNNATIDIRPDNKNNNSYSNIYINNQNSFPISFNFNLDNSGSKSTGEKLLSASVGFDNLLSVNDNLYLKYTQNLDTENSKRYNKAFYGSLGIPFGYWTFNTNLNYSKYLTTVSGYYTTFNTSGNTLTQTYNLDRVLFKTQLYKFNLGTDLMIKDTKSYVRNFKSQTGSRRSSNVDIYLNNTIYTKLGTIIIKPSYQKGLKLFNSKKDEDYSTILKTDPKLQYDLIKFYAYYNTKINLPLLTKTKIKYEDKANEKQNFYEIRNKMNLNYTLSFDSQYSWNTLYGTDQFSIGGEYTVRGFREETISGDNGYYIRNDLSANLKQLFPRFLLDTKLMNYGNIINGKDIKLSINDFLNRMYLSIFYDYGYVKDKYLDANDRQYNSQSGYMAGTGLALNYYGKYLNWSLTCSKALRAPQYLQTRDGIKKEIHSIYWRVRGSF